MYPTLEEPDEALWLHAAARNPAFEFLNDPEEDIYTLTDGKPVQYLCSSTLNFWSQKMLNHEGHEDHEE